MSKQLIFKPNPDELDHIYTKIDSWTDWCRSKLKNDKKDNKAKFVETVGSRLLLLVSGLLIASISYLTTYIIIIIASFLVGSLLILIGTVSLWRIYLNGR